VLSFLENIKRFKDARIDKLGDSHEKKKRFSGYMNLIFKNNMCRNKLLVVNGLISTIVEYMNFLEAVQALETHRKVQNNSLIEKIYNIIASEVSQSPHSITLGGMIEDEQKCCNQEGVELVDNKYLKIHINQLPILLNPWKGKGVIGALEGINENNVFDGAEYSWNIQNHYLYPMNIIICHGGNHSQFVAKIKNRGYTIVNELHDYSKVYDLVEFDGENYLKRVDKSIIELDYNEHILFYSGVIFEMGRYILKNNYHSLNLAKEKFKINHV